jgi:predicted transcriptional regulator
MSDTNASPGESTAGGDATDVPAPDEQHGTLRLTADPPADALAADAAAFGDWADGETPPDRHNVADVSDLRAVLTARRVELIRSLMNEPAPSMSALADRLDRNPAEVHDDLHLLAEYNIVHFREGDGRAKSPTVPYDTIELSASISA